MGLGVVKRGLVALGLSHLGEFQGVGSFALQAAHGLDIGGQAGALAHQALGGGGVVPKVWILGAGVQFVQPPQRRIPVKDAS